MPERSSRTGVILIGAGFKNRGAEAMAWTALREISEHLPGSHLTLTSYNKGEPLAYGRHEHPSADGLFFEFLCNRPTAWQVLCVALACILPAGMRGHVARWHPYLCAIDRAYAVVDLGGYALSDQRPLKRRIVYALEVLTARVFGARFIAFAQSFGPFEKAATRVLARYALRHCDRIFARGVESTAWVAKLLGPEAANLQTCCDSAYLFRDWETTRSRRFVAELRSSNRPVFAIVPNVNLCERTAKTSQDNAYLALLRDAARHAAVEWGAQVVVLVHEHFPGRRLDDRIIAEELADRLSQDVDLHITPPDFNAAELKSILTAMDFVLTSRFHSVVAAISKRRPFLVLGWSHKYDEMIAETGVQECVLNGRIVGREDVLNRLDLLWSKRDSLRMQLEAAAPRQEAEAARAFDRLAETLSRAHAAART